MIYVYAPLYASGRSMFRCVKIIIGLLSVLMLILMSLNFLTSRASYIIDPDTGVKQGLKVRVLFLNLESDQKYYEMIMIGRRVVFGIHIRCC